MKGDVYKRQAMVIPKNAKNPDLAHAFINFASDYAGAYDNSSYVGYTSANQEVMDAIYGEGGEYEGIDAYIPRTDNKNDEVFEYNAETKKIIGDQMCIRDRCISLLDLGLVEVATYS